MVARLEAVLRRGVWSIRRGISYLLEGWSSSCAVLRRGVWSIKDGVSATCRHRVTVQGRNCVSLICCGRRPFISSSHLLIMGGPSKFVDSWQWWSDGLGAFLGHHRQLAELTFRTWVTWVCMWSWEEPLLSPFAYAGTVDHACHPGSDICFYFLCLFCLF